MITTSEEERNAELSSFAMKTVLPSFAWLYPQQRITYMGFNPVDVTTVFENLTVRRFPNWSALAFNWHAVSNI